MAIRAAALVLCVLAAAITVSADVFVTDGPSLYNALLGPGPGSIRVESDGFALTRGLTTSGKWLITNAPGFAPIIDISTVSYTEAFLIHGGAVVTIEGLTFDGKGVPRSAPAIYLTGASSALTFESSEVLNSYVTSVGSIAGAIECDRNTKLVIGGSTLFQNDTAADGGAIGATASCNARICFPIWDDPGADILVSGSANVQTCYTGPDTAPITIHLNGTYFGKPSSSTATCPLAACKKF